MSELGDALASLSLDESLADELSALEAIYGAGSVLPSCSSSGALAVDVQTTLQAPHEDAALHLSLVNDAGGMKPPRVKLESVYLGAFKVTSELEHTIASWPGEHEWTAGEPCLFDAVEAARTACTEFVASNHDDKAARELSRRAEHTSQVERVPEKGHKDENEEQEEGEEEEPLLPKGVELVIGEAFTQLKSVFVGHACSCATREQAMAVLRWILRTDKKVARATHNIWAYRLYDTTTTGTGRTSEEHDDDGESAAGGRLATLLKLTDARNVVVIVSRWYGGVHLGPDRFKLINMAARDALEQGGFIARSEGKKTSGNNSKKR